MFTLSLFPGIGMLDMAFEEAGFCVVRGPDVIWGGDIRKFDPPAGKFDGVIGGPPCQMFSALANIVRAKGFTPKFGNLIPEFERCVAAARPQWFVMEEVPGAPVPVVTGYGVHSFILCNRQLGEVPRRRRRWSFGYRGERRVLMIETVALEPVKYERAATGGHSFGLSNHDPRRKNFDAKSCLNNFRRSQVGLEALLRKQGLPPDHLKHCPLTIEGKCQAVGNGVPMAMGRAIAAAVLEACGSGTEDGNQTADASGTSFQRRKPNDS